MNTEYTEFKRGSEWRRWDLHIHTPETKKHDQFPGQTVEEKWNLFLDAINNSESEIHAVGVTDYFSVENYFKLKEFNQNGRITKPFSLLIPNIELRITPVTGESTPVNIHCLFDPKIDSEIEGRFLSKLNFNFSGSDYSATKSELCRLGRSFTGDIDMDEESAFKQGLEQYVLSFDNIRKVFEKDPGLRENVIIVVSNKSTDGVTGIVNHEDFFTENGSQLDATRRSIYQFSDAIFSSNEGDRKYFLGLKADDKHTVIRKCRSLKPCYHGSDAHSLDKLFLPDDNRFCWIKADLTFEGLRQTLYEPEDRVKIQAFKPEVKNGRHIISEIQFIDEGETFGNQRILLNPNLNSIIGGKSSGKSLLLYAVAKSVDPEQVNRTSSRLDFEGYKFEDAINFKITWSDGQEDSFKDDSTRFRKITYIPQLYINHLVEKNNKEELNSLIDQILRQDSSFKVFYQEKKENVRILTEQINLTLQNLFDTRTRAIDIQQKSRELGKSDAITKGIETLLNRLTEGQKLTNLTQQEFTTYTGIVAKKGEKDKELAVIEQKDKIVKEIIAELERKENLLFGFQEESTGLYSKGTIETIIGTPNAENEDLQGLLKIVRKKHKEFISGAREEISKLNIASAKKGIVDEIAILVTSLIPYTDKIAGQKELEKLTQDIELEKKKLISASQLEKQLQDHLTEFNEVKQRIASLMKGRYACYMDIVNEINTKYSEIGSEIKLACKLKYNVGDFMLFNQVNRANISSDHYFHKLYDLGGVQYDLIPPFFENKIIVREGELIIGIPGNDKEIKMPLRQNVSFENILSGLITDNFRMDFQVDYKGDELLRMSPGKKGTVLLILFLQLSSAEYPILIDQPEDNLDNRTIYDLLCTMIRKKKRERQIIIVSHNANLVVATDSENILVANQRGQDDSEPGGSLQFEYVNGALEHSFRSDINSQSELHRQGIKEHVCDILEGGNEAFDQRSKKYRKK